MEANLEETENEEHLIHVKQSVTFVRKIALYYHRMRFFLNIYINFVLVRTGRSEHGS